MRKPEFSLNENNHKPTLNPLRFEEKDLENFFKENFKSMCAYCQMKFNFDIDLSKEMVQTGFIKLWESRNQLTANLSLKSYLYQIITNNCLDTIRHEGVKTRYEMHVKQASSHPAFNTISTLADLDELRSTIDKAVYSLPAQMRTIFELSRYEGMKYVQIAEFLNISIKTVETQMSRALVKLRQKLADRLIIFFFIVFACKNIF